MFLSKNFTYIKISLNICLPRLVVLNSKSKYPLLIDMFDCKMERMSEEGNLSDSDKTKINHRETSENEKVVIGTSRCDFYYFNALVL